MLSSALFINELSQRLNLVKAETNSAAAVSNYHSNLSLFHRRSGDTSKISFDHRDLDLSGLLDLSTSDRGKRLNLTGLSVANMVRNLHPPVKTGG